MDFLMFCLRLKHLCLTKAFALYTLIILVKEKSQKLET